MDHIDKIYKKLMDRQSKEIFKSRLIYSLTGDYDEICHMAAQTSQAAEIRRQIGKFPGAPVFIWGTGFWSGYIRKGFPEINWCGYVDNNQRETMKDGLQVLGPEEFREKYQDATVVIATTVWYSQIYEQLLSYQFTPDRIVDAGRLMVELFDRQYFDLPYLGRSEEEVFVDAGCFDGETVKNFVKWSGGKYKEIIAFEPDGKCYERCCGTLGDVKKLSLINRGLWDSEQILSFHETGNSDSAITENGEVQIRTVRLDDMAGDRNVTFLKMDIEGAEMKALIGSANTIRRSKPKLAISLYHKAEDVWELPRLILDIRPDYVFYLRHYSLRDAETVLYAL